MRLAKLEIHNYRSIDHATIYPDALTTFIGKNSVGKSNVLGAIKFFFSASSKSCEPQDICQFTDEANAWVEATFSGLSDSEEDALSKYVLHDNSVRFRRLLAVQEDGETKAELNGYVESPDEEWLQTDYPDFKNETRWKELGIDFWKYAKPSKSGSITIVAFKEFRLKYAAEHSADISYSLTLSDTKALGRDSSAVAALPHLIFVPAIGDVTSVVYGLKSSLLNQIVGSTIAAAREQSEFKKAQASLDAAQELVNPSTRRLNKLAEIERQLENN